MKDQKMVPTVRTLLWEEEREKTGLGSGGDEKEALGLQSMETKTLPGSQAEGQQLLRPCCHHDAVRERNRTQAWATERSCKLRMRKRVED